MKNKLNLRLILVIGIATTYLLFAHFTGKQKQVYIDTNVLLTGYEAMKDAKVEFEGKVKVWEANVDSIYKAFEKEIKTYEKERSKMSKKEQELKTELLRNKQNQINNYREAMIKKKNEEEQKLNQSVINMVNEYIKEYGESHNYKIIFGASGMGNILYAEEGMDITQDVLEGLNKEYKR